MSAPMADIRVLAVDPGPCAKAAATLIVNSTLAQYVTIRRDGMVFVIEPLDATYSLDMAGSATQGLWRLLRSIAYSRYEVSLHDVVSRLDPRNRRALALAMAALCGDDR